MIFKLKLPNKIEFAQAKDSLNLVQEYIKKYGCKKFLNILDITIIEPTQAKKYMIKKTDNSEISLYDLQKGDDFAIIGSTEIE